MEEDRIDNGGPAGPEELPVTEERRSARIRTESR